MSVAERSRFERFGRLDTWIVGIQYHEGAKRMDSPEVYFDRDPDNPFDPNAIAVYTPRGCQIGHVPRYDAEYFSPLIAEGVIALKGQVGKGERGDRLPLALEVFSTTKVSAILARDDRDDWRAIYHNLFITLWARLGEYSSAALEEFRSRFRPLAHEQAFYPKTQFLYRMLKAHIADIEKQEELRLRDQILAAVTAMNFGPVSGWPEMTVIPLDAAGVILAPPPGNTALDSVPVPRDARLSEVLRQLPARCPYPAGAHGAVILVRGEWFSLDWYAAAECAQVCWYQTILAGLEKALEKPSPGTDEASCTPEEIKAAILETLGLASYSRQGTEEAGGGRRIDIGASRYQGSALQRGGSLEYLRLRGGDDEVICEAPKAVAKPLQVGWGKDR